jgi:hypothetical protein
MTAPTIALTALTQNDEMKSAWIVGSANALRFAKVNDPVLVKNPLATATTAGIARKSRTYAANGVSPSHATLRRRGMVPTPLAAVVRAVAEATVIMCG